MRLLVVEDDPSTLDYLATYLRRHGYDVLTARTGTEALSVVDRELVGMVVLDLGLPDIDGLAVCRELRRRPGYLPILMLTAWDSTADELNGFAVAADDYLRKPAEPLVLLARLRALERTTRRGVTRDVVRLIGGVEVDFAVREVRRGGVPAPLGPRSFAVLAYLVQHPGQVLAKSRIIEHVWGLDPPEDTSAVEWHVTRVREALGDVRRPYRYVLTRRGEGYLMPTRVVVS